MRRNQSTNYGSPQGGGAVSNLNGLENHEVAQKVLKYKERKAKNQRRYYQNHKYVQQEMGRRRSAKNRLLAKEGPWMRRGDCDQDHLTSTDVNNHTPTLVPVFDPVFFSTRMVSPVKRFNPALQHVFSVNLRGTVSVRTQDSMAV